MGGWLNIENFMAAAERANLGVVIVGGFFGGVLQPIVATLAPGLKTPSGELLQNTLLSGVLGIAAAGISIYVFADFTNTEAIRLMFLALTSGLAFPAVLTAAAEAKGPQPSQLQQQVLKIAGDTAAADVETTIKGAKKLQQVLGQNPTEFMGTDGQGVIEIMAQQAVSNIAQTDVKSAEDQRKVVTGLKEVGTAAQSAGWEKTRQSVIEQLTNLGKTLPSKEARDEAEQAVKGLSEGDTAP